MRSTAEEMRSAARGDHLTGGIFHISGLKGEKSKNGKGAGGTKMTNLTEISSTSKNQDLNERELKSKWGRGTQTEGSYCCWARLNTGVGQPGSHVSTNAHMLKPRELGQAGQDAAAMLMRFRGSAQTAKRWAP